MMIANGKSATNTNNGIGNSGKKINNNLTSAAKGDYHQLASSSPPNNCSPINNKVHGNTKSVNVHLSTTNNCSPVSSVALTDDEQYLHSFVTNEVGQDCDHEPGLEFDDSELRVSSSGGEDFEDLSEDDMDNQPRKPGTLPTGVGGGANGVVDINAIYLESPSELIDDNFEEALRGHPINDGDLDSFFIVPENRNGKMKEEEEEDNFDDIHQYGIVEVAGDDMYGRKVITISACRLPSNKQFNHNRFLK